MKYAVIHPPANYQKLDVYGYISSRKWVFWDFDGVIKDSVDVKTEAYVRLFSAYGSDVAAKVKAHHEANGGVSRYEKIPLYLTWVGLPNDQEHIDQFCSRFSDLVFDAVVESAWVPGVREYLLGHCQAQYFVLVTATPQQEIESILESIGIAHCFRQLHGAPTPKKDAIAAVLRAWRIDVADVLMIGDSETDRSSADANNVPFLLRRTKINSLLQSSYRGPQFEDLIR
jgi:phosphoglycolate phosphatase-like HAD superfamily hydrolase